MCKVRLQYATGGCLSLFHTSYNFSFVLFHDDVPFVSDALDWKLYNTFIFSSDRDKLWKVHIRNTFFSLGDHSESIGTACSREYTRVMNNL
jgi:hypothetical protein